MSKSEVRQTKLPHSMHEFEAMLKAQRQLPGVDKNDTIAEDTEEIEQATPLTPERNLLHRELHEAPKSSMASRSIGKLQKSGRFPPSEVWNRYHQFWEADEAGTGYMAHDHTVEHNIVIIKTFRVHASSEQCRRLQKVIRDKPLNIVRLIETFPGDLAVDVVYESTETSLYHIRATCLREITEIELAIIAREVRYKGHSEGVHISTLVLGIKWSPIHPQSAEHAIWPTFSAKYPPVLS